MKNMDIKEIFGKAEILYDYDRIMRGNKIRLNGGVFNVIDLEGGYISLERASYPNIVVDGFIKDDKIRLNHWNGWKTFEILQNERL